MDNIRIPGTDYAVSRNNETRQVLTFDDLPLSKWRDKMVSFIAWMKKNCQLYDIPTVIICFILRMEGRLKDWYDSLWEYRQRQLRQSETIDRFLSYIYLEFIGSPDRHIEHARKEYLLMKYCSFAPKDLEKHYNQMSQRFYIIDGINLQQVFLNSYPDTLCAEVHKIMKFHSVSLQENAVWLFKRLHEN